MFEHFRTVTHTYTVNVVLGLKRTHLQLASPCWRFMDNTPRVFSSKRIDYSKIMGAICVFIHQQLSTDLIDQTVFLFDE